ncbi:N-myristoyl transferase [Neolentinus lepideus HHB14362 ss-1]|uniref:Glycylpeptide N-tetradecanoyltransferase n=1 Tax=Neolentinus lepideus HHB14362 ss-1 TaxID=1314782 RepID=A0A165TAU7_9AGAM|nr:N-myristoyl transferase [Neolentinus lepideus HHB14362 ss-1]
MSSQSTSQKDKAEEIIDTTVEEHLEEASGSSEGEEEVDTSTPQASSSAGTSQKKKKKRAKIAKALNVIKGQKQVPQGVVDEVLGRVKQEHGDVEGVDEQTVRMALDQLKIMDYAKGKTGIGGKGKKDAGDHKFWGTQPVPQLGDEIPTDDGPIESSKLREEVRQDPYPLPKDFQWSIVDLSDSNQLKEVYELLSLNYVEDHDATFRFQYTAEFLQWALQPPGYHKEWHVGVRVTSNKKLVGFISGVPITLKIRDHVVKCSEINYLCVHKKLRSKRLAPVLIKEVTRQCHLKGIFQAIYTAGVLLPTPITVCRYYHRSLNVPKLVDTKFTYVPRNQTLARMIRLQKVPSSPHLPIREMTEGDLAQVANLYERYMKRFDMIPLMSLEEIRHHFLSGLGKGDMVKGRRDGQVVWSYVVEDPSSHKITDFFTFYSLPSTIINNPKHSLLEAAYLFYYASETAFSGESEEEPDNNLKKRLTDLISDALVVANEASFDVFNALTLMDNVPFLNDLKFGAGDGMLNFYLYNWRAPPLAGMKAIGDREAGRGVGVVML